MLWTNMLHHQISRRMVATYTSLPTDGTRVLWSVAIVVAVRETTAKVLFFRSS